MTIWVHPYQLKPRVANIDGRLGALVKVEWEPHQIGHSDLHPWPEFGDQPLDAHLESLASLAFTPLAELSLEFNYIDREYRRHKRNAFLGMALPRTHRLVHDIEAVRPKDLQSWLEQGFTHVKVKMGRSLEAETQALTSLSTATALLWRVDLGGRVDERRFTAWWKGLDQALRARIDFVEDPVTAGEALRIRGPWADDWQRLESARIKVVKPARESSEELSSFERVIFTHSLDHPFGQACALWSAAQFYGENPRVSEVCGLAAPEIYEPDAFSRAWSCPGPQMKPTAGTGFGFDDVLESLKWERIL